MRDGVKDNDLALHGVDERVGKAVEYVPLCAFENGPNSRSLKHESDSSIDLAKERLGGVRAPLEVPIEPGIDVVAGTARELNV